MKIYHPKQCLYKKFPEMLKLWLLANTFHPSFKFEQMKFNHILCHQVTFFIMNTTSCSIMTKINEPIIQAKFSNCNSDNMRTEIPQIYYICNQV